jgi:hypothetical protein
MSSKSSDEGEKLRQKFYCSSQLVKKMFAGCGLQPSGLITPIYSTAIVQVC